MPYRRGFAFEDLASDGVAGLAVLLIGIALTIIVAALLEIGRVYTRWAFTSTPIARALWVAAASLAALIVTSIAFQSLLLFGYSFLAYVIFVELVDWAESAAQPEEMSLDDVVTEWRAA